MSLNILIVDDSSTARAMIVKTLKLSGLQIGQLHQAQHGQEALEIMEQSWVDLILADINMPVMNGVEMVERMSERGMLKTAPVIVVSTDGSSARREQLARHGVKTFIRKPFAPEAVRDAVQALLGLKKGA